MRWLSPPDRVAEARLERQVFEADAVEEAEPLVDLLQDALGDVPLLGRQLAVERRRTTRPPGGWRSP